MFITFFIKAKRSQNEQLNAHKTSLILYYVVQVMFNTFITVFYVLVINEDTCTIDLDKRFILQAALNLVFDSRYIL